MLRAALAPVALLALSCTPSRSTALDASPASSAAPAPTPPPAVVAAAASPAPLPSAALPLSDRAAAALAADRESWIVDTHFQLSPPLRSQYVEDTFFVLAADASAPFDAAVDLTRKTVSALWHGPFQFRPERAVLLWIYSSHVKMLFELGRYAPHTRNDGYGVYVPERREIYLATDTAGLFTLCHELVHPMLEADFARAPLWLAEGLASLFELPDFSVPGEIHGMPTPRLDDLRDVLKSPDSARLVSLDAMFALTTDDAFRTNEPLHYAASRHFMRWLDRRHQLWPWYHAYRDGVLTDPTGEKAFVATVGKTPAEANAEFVAWIKSREAEDPTVR
jgi:hypothetical protein